MVSNRSTKRCFQCWGVFLFLIPAMLATPTRADTYDFYNITNTSVWEDGTPVDTSGWFSVEISGQTGGDTALFKFFNNAPADSLSAICAVYFYDGAFLSEDNDPDLGYGGSNVFFQEGAFPGDLPGFYPVIPEGIRVFNADADPPPTQGGAGYGVHTGEWLSVLFELDEGTTFDAVIDSLNLTGSTTQIPGTLQIGLKVQATPGYDDQTGIWAEDNGSDSFVLVPVPGAVLLAFLGLGTAGIKLRKKHE